jgi:hypothetical protein
VARFDEVELAKRSRLFRAYHGIRGRLLTRLTKRVPALKPLHGWPVPEPYTETIPAQRPGGNFGQAPAPAASSPTPTAVSSR